MSASTLVISEPLDANGRTPAGTQSTVTAATKLNNGNDINLLVVGGISPTKIPSGLSKVYHVPIEDKLSETVATAVASIVDEDCTVVMGTASKFGSTVVPRAAALLDVSPVTDISEIQDEKTFIRPMYAGNVLGKIVAHPGPNGSNLRVLSIRPTCFGKADLVDPTSVETVETVTAFDKAEWIGESISKSEGRPDLGSANIVVSGGRGIKSGDNFPILEALADKLGAAVGASRAAVDAGFCPNDWQVGQTGKVVAPDLYIAAGISGAIQHLSGMKDSKVIVAINTDPDAPIFQVADFGLKQDLFEAVPELTEKI